MVILRGGGGFGGSHGLKVPRDLASRRAPRNPLRSPSPTRYVSSPLAAPSLPRRRSDPRAGAPLSSGVPDRPPVADLQVGVLGGGHGGHGVDRLRLGVVRGHFNVHVVRRRLGLLGAGRVLAAVLGGGRALFEGEPPVCVVLVGGRPDEREHHGEEHEAVRGPEEADPEELLEEHPEDVRLRRPQHQHREEGGEGAVADIRAHL
mmetsp:Transcript_34745/g.82332  ORF Transcript_34745/g.82332 Transcript_34745/m.82332 type:complete len:204 (+) Transcript_34745:26-637(+)